MNNTKVIKCHYRTQSRHITVLDFFIIKYDEKFISLFLKKERKKMYIYFGKVYFQHEVEG